MTGDLEDRRIEWLEFDRSREHDGQIGFGLSVEEAEDDPDPAG